ncbi:MAG: FAD-dependent oxidoreductase [Acidimicrobiales bacterium]|nr:FAD-dependent oxidoreductase [Acidimicrobiales bacterium]
MTEVRGTQRPSGGKVAILGGGMGGLAAAWRLSEEGWRDRFDKITVYQRGHRLGGKGASHRGVNGRIEEHGLHIWLGYYDNAFRLLRHCYDELDRDRTRPGCPIRSVEDALKPSVEVGLEHRDDDGWEHWIGSFARNDLRPGDDPRGPVSFTGADIVARALRLLGDFHASLSGARPTAGVTLSASSRPPSATTAGGLDVAVATLAVAIEALGMIDTFLRPLTSSAPVVAVLDEALRSARAMLSRGMPDDSASRRTWNLVSVVLAQVRGIVSEGLLADPAAFAKLNDEDYREWSIRHGASPEAVDSTLIRGLYDLVFGYEDGDPARPGFAAGLGVFLSGKTFFDYKGAIFWKMQAGMGDVVFAPLYEALRARGVDFEFFHRVDDLHLDDTRSHVEAVTIGRQVALAPGFDRYEPLVEMNGLPVFPEHPLVDQLRDAEGIDDHDLESFWCRWPDAESRVLRRGVDFDQVVFAIPVGMARHVCGELIDHDERWRAMVDGMGTVATQALQLWLRESEGDLGWDAPGSTMSGFVEPFDTWASMPQLIDAEDWPAGDRPGTIAYYCNTFPTPGDEEDPTDHEHPRRCHDQVRLNAVEFMESELRHQLPGAVGAEGFRWDLLCGAGDVDGEGRLDSQYWRANVDPSDRYVQSLPGTDRLRLRPDGSGFENLVLAGDWTDSGLNAGCIEAAVLSGLKAANALVGLDPGSGVVGVYM